MRIKKLELSDIIDEQKYRQKGETYDEKIERISDTLADNAEHKLKLKDILGEKRFLPAGRIQAAVGAARVTTPYNCFVSGTIDDDFNDIMDKVKEAGQTMRKGGGIGYDFSTLRPRGDIIRSLHSTASGPISFMEVYDSTCATVLSAGHRRGAQMGVLRVDHPDIVEFIEAKQNSNKLTNFNVSIGVTDKFMEAVKGGTAFDLVFEGRVYKTVDARDLWKKIMESTWDWAEPGVLFIDRINRKNNLWYAEHIAATNPCGEQPLPPYGACLLGSFNLTRYIYNSGNNGNVWSFDFDKFKHDISYVVRAMDNVIDVATYPLPQQEREAKSKRRMGLGVTGLANTGEILGYPYASTPFKLWMETVFKILRDTAYRASIELAIEKGPFPLFDKEKYVSETSFIATLPEDIRSDIANYGIRNSHLLSIAPTGTISLVAGNVSSGIEPPFSFHYTRDVYLESGKKETFDVYDYAYKQFGVRGRSADEIDAEDHVEILNIASNYVDSACSKTCNVGGHVTFERFKDLYVRAYEGGASGCTTFRADGKRFGVLRKKEEEPKEENEGGACFIDPDTGQKECS